MTRPFLQEMAHYAVHNFEGCVLWCDGDHGFNPYDFAERNMERGFDAEWGADRVLIKRCMTPFQWDTVLTKHLERKLLVAPAGLVIAAPYEGLFSTDELKDWEREDYVHFSLKHLKGLASRFGVPVVLGVDMASWCHTHPLIAWAAYEAAASRWTLQRHGDGWSASELVADLVVTSAPARQSSLGDYQPSVWKRTEIPVIPRRATQRAVAQG